VHPGKRSERRKYKVGQHAAPFFNRKFEKKGKKRERELEKLKSCGILLIQIFYIKIATDHKT
jgi:hypothetical protein